MALVCFFPEKKIHQNFFLEKLILIDATYNVTKYTLPLFFVCVKTNVDFLVIGQFITHFEDADSISEALGMLLSWNTSWSPRNVMCDFFDAEINAIKIVFPAALILVCDFHRGGGGGGGGSRPGEICKNG